MSAPIDMAAAGVATMQPRESNFDLRSREPNRAAGVQSAVHRTDIENEAVKVDKVEMISDPISVTDDMRSDETGSTIDLLL